MYKHTCTHIHTQGLNVLHSKQLITVQESLLGSYTHLFFLKRIQVCAEMRIERMNERGQEREESEKEKERQRCVLGWLAEVGVTFW